MTLHGGNYEIRLHVLINISISIYNKTMKIGQFIINTRENFFSKKDTEKVSLTN